jgi:hypothetical protein
VSARAIIQTMPLAYYLRVGVPASCLEWLDFPQDEEEMRAAITIAAKLRSAAEQFILQRARRVVL